MREFQTMEIVPKVHFDDTATAFSYKTDQQLKKAHFIFSLVNHPWVSAVATGAARLALALGLPVKGLIRATVFEHFCGGETIAQSEKTIQTLSKFHVGTILDYSVEGEKSEAGFDASCEEILRTLDRSRGHQSIPFCVFKMTGMADAALLEKIQAKGTLNEDEKTRFQHVRDRVEKICARAASYDVPILIDAEETWIQNPIDQLATEMMRKFNTKKAIVFTTIQFYRTDGLAKLKEAYHDATMHNYFLGVKMVRGAYMEKERERAEKMGYASPIHPTKEATDECFNKGLAFCLDNKQRITVMCGSHNEYSNQYLSVLMDKHGLANNDGRVWFAQLLGMSDNISFNLAKEGYNVAKYVPYGPVEAVMPYLIRRAHENTSVAGQSSRELGMIRKELRRRKGK